jgi:hypothetical protein
VVLAHVGRRMWSSGVPSQPGLRIMVTSKPGDFHKGLDPLAALVMQVLASDPFLRDSMRVDGGRS